MAFWTAGAAFEFGEELSAHRTELNGFGPAHAMPSSVVNGADGITFESGGRCPD